MVKEGEEEGRGRGGGTCSKVLGGIDAPATERRRYDVTACSCCYTHSVSSSEVLPVCARADPGLVNGGAKVEAPQAGGVWGGGVPSPTGEGAMPLPRKFS